MKKDLEASYIYIFNTLSSYFLIRCFLLGLNKRKFNYTVPIG